MSQHRQSCWNQTRARQHVLIHSSHEANYCRWCVIIVVLANKINAFHQLKTQHYSTSTTSSILYFTSIFGLAVNCYILRKAVIDPMASLSIPTAHGLINTNTVRRTEVICSVVIEVGDKVINQLPSVLLRRFGISRSRRLVTPPHCPEQVIKSVLRHPSEAKVRCRSIL